MALAGEDIRKRLLAVGREIKEKYHNEFENLKNHIVKLSLKSLPKHLRKMREFELQFTFYSDGWFLLHCINTLLENGKLKLPTEDQRKALTTLILHS